jgi:protein phosphatase
VLQSSLGGKVAGELCSQTQGWVFVVADGMGGQAGGAEASALAVETSLKYLRTLLPLILRMDLDQLEMAEEVLRTAICLCHEDVLDRAADAPASKRQMGTTLTLAFVLWPQLFVVHVGDSRCYLLRDGTMRQITRDHTMAQEMIDGGLDPEVARPSPRLENALTNVVGGGDDQVIKPDVLRLTMEQNDSILLCTDGLTKMLPDDRIRELTNRETFANARCQALIEAANEAGGRDNITVVVGSFEQQQLEM